MENSQTDYEPRIILHAILKANVCNRRIRVPLNRSNYPIFRFQYSFRIKRLSVTSFCEHSMWSYASRERASVKVIILPPIFTRLDVIELYVTPFLNTKIFRSISAQNIVSHSRHYYLQVFTSSS